MDRFYKGLQARIHANNWKLIWKANAAHDASRYFNGENWRFWAHSHIPYRRWRYSTVFHPRMTYGSKPDGASDPQQTNYRGHYGRRMQWFNACNFHHSNNMNAKAKDRGPYEGDSQTRESAIPSIILQHLRKQAIRRNVKAEAEAKGETKVKTENAAAKVTEETTSNAAAATTNAAVPSDQAYEIDLITMRKRPISPVQEKPLDSYESLAPNDSGFSPTPESEFQWNIPEYNPSVEIAKNEASSSEIQSPEESNLSSVPIEGTGISQGVKAVEIPNAEPIELLDTVESPESVLGTEQLQDYGTYATESDISSTPSSFSSNPSAHSDKPVVDTISPIILASSAKPSIAKKAIPMDKISPELIMSQMARHVTKDQKNTARPSEIEELEKDEKNTDETKQFPLKSPKLITKEYSNGTDKLDHLLAFISEEAVIPQTEKFNLSTKDRVEASGKRVVKPDFEIEDLMPNDVRIRYSNKPGEEHASAKVDQQDLESLEQSLQKAQEWHAKSEQEQFRKERAFEYSVAVSSSKNPRTLDSKNFFTPVYVDEFWVPYNKAQARKGLSKEYIILTPTQKLIRTKTLPFKDQRPQQDLFSALSEISNPERYVKTLSKLEKNGWSLIGGGGPSELLVFEREYNKNKRRARYIFRLFTYTTGAVTALFLGLVLLVDSPTTSVTMP